jgi:hypothetical protein
MLRRLLLPALTVLLLAAAAQPVFAAGRHCHRSRHARETVSARTYGSVIAVTYQRGASQRVHFLQLTEAIDRVAIRDVDNDGDLDIIAAPHDGRLLLWRNAGHGRFSLASLPRGRRLASKGPRFERIQHRDDGWQWGVERYGAAMPRAPAVATVAPIAIVRVTPQVSLRSAPLPASSGRAPPLA